MFELGNAYKNQLLDGYTENKYYSTAIKVNMEDKNNTKVIIADYVKSKSVCLDVGCGAGYLGKVLHDHKKAKVYGIDVDKTALEYAAKTDCFVDLYNFSVTEKSGKEFKRFVGAKLKFDYIIFADILEHVINAEEVLMLFSKFLKPNGRIIVSLPNVAHFDIVRGLMDGKFNYNHIGLLDNTHLRFYTKSSFKEFIQQINEVLNQDYVVKEIGKTVLKPEYIKDYPNMYKLLNEKQEACVLQYVYEISVGGKGKRDNNTDNKNHTFNKLEELLAEREENLVKCKNLSGRVTELEKAIDKIYKSRSWRIMKPIRGVSKVIGKIKRK